MSLDTEITSLFASAISNARKIRQAHIEDFIGTAGEIEFCVKGHIEPADPSTGSRAGFRVTRVWLDTDLLQIDILAALKKSTVDVLADQGMEASFD